MRWLFWAHRWLGIGTCLLCALWLGSGLVMLYVPYPSWRDAERIAFLPALDAARIAVLPGEALAKAALTRAPTVFRLEMLGDEPVYRIVDFGKPVSVSAVDGRIIGPVESDEAARLLARGVRAPLRYLGRVDADQWTLSRLLAPHRPLHLFEAADGEGSRYYLSSRTGEIVQSTTARERLWNWVGSVPHWLYFRALRENAGLWRNVVMWTAGLAAVGSLLGLWIGFVRVRFRRSFRNGRLSPYRGLMKWHHVTGLLAGISLPAWLASGWLSVSPFGLLAGLPVTPDQLARYYVSGEPTFETSLDVLTGTIGPTTKEVQLTWVGDEPLLVATDGNAREACLAKSGRLLQLAERDIAIAAQRVFPDHRIVRTERLEDYDVYWYRHHADRPLPVTRVVFDDPGRTWLTVDLVTGRIVDASSSDDRWRRWLFNFVHLYDHPSLLSRPVVRDVLLWVLSLLGLVVTLTGAIAGARFLRRGR